MPATEVDLRDYRSFSLRKLKFLREIVPLHSVRDRLLVELPSKIRRTSTAGMNSGVAS